MKHRPALQTLFQSANLAAIDHFIDGASLHLEEVYRWNQRMDLTAIPEDQAPEKHTLDSVLPFARITAPSTLLDIGSGAGFPGIPIALWWPETRVTLLEPLRKRRSFLESVCARLELTCPIQSESAEELSAATWDMVTSRATLPWPLLISVAPRLLNPGGTLVALLGPEQSPSPGELDAIKRQDHIWSKLALHHYSLPSRQPRVALVGTIRAGQPGMAVPPRAR